MYMESEISSVCLHWSLRQLLLRIMQTVLIIYLTALQLIQRPMRKYRISVTETHLHLAPRLGALIVTPRIVYVCLHGVERDNFAFLYWNGKGVGEMTREWTETRAQEMIITWISGQKRTECAKNRRLAIKYHTTSGLSINIKQLDALNFIISLFQASTCFLHMCSSSGGQNCIIQSLVSSHL